MVTEMGKQERDHRAEPREDIFTWGGRTRGWHIRSWGQLCLAMAASSLRRSRAQRIGRPVSAALGGDDRFLVTAGLLWPSRWALSAYKVSPPSGKLQGS